MASANEHFALVVVGGGHAGAEAAWAAANVLRDQFHATQGQAGRVVLVTMDPNRIGQMSCNPAIGGLAKGQMVREIDALGGLMGLAIDATGIQFRLLNASKGPAVRGPRAQADKYRYARKVQQLLRTRPNLTIIQGTVERILAQGDRCTGCVIRSDSRDESTTLGADALVLTTGTFMRGLMHTGENQTPGGRVDESAADALSDHLRKLGFELGRLKTGTPPRLDARTIDFSQTEPQPGDDPPRPFSELTRAGLPGPADQPDAPGRFPALPQRLCHITHTNRTIHQLIRDNLHRAPLFNGQIVESVGPRYCPSIEDKIVKFPDKPSHHVFLEPESLETDEVYCNGIPTSLPADVQDQIVRQLPGCEGARILRYGYAVEYDMVWPHQVDATTMAKRLPGLFLAGQINGTSGYEEAAAQGLLAGLNAVRHIRREPLIRLDRDQAYLGVLMDDLVTKVPREPYRMFTSRAEHRLLLRSDNAPDRLTPLGREWGLVDDRRWSAFQRRREASEAIEGFLRKANHNGVKLWAWIKRPEADIQEVARRLRQAGLPDDPYLLERLFSDVRYAGFIEHHRRQHERISRMEHTLLPAEVKYESLAGLRNEARAVLERFRPATLGQAGRLAGITPADLTVLAVALNLR
jgi:tRNA uridine 5-carboxymethylaminomethyl modification enzyme